MSDAGKWAKRMARMYQDGRRQGLIDASRAASHFTMRDNWSIHPDILGEDMNQSARTAAHSTAQQIALLIQAMIEPMREV